MFKGALLIIIIASAGTMGLIKSNSYGQRVRQLQQLQNLLKHIDTEISYRKDTLPSVFYRTALAKDDITAEFLMRCLHYMDNKLPIGTCWTNAVKDVLEGTSLTKDDLNVFYDLASQIGNTNIKGQNEIFKLAEEKIMMQIDEAVSEKNSKGKMYGGLGFSVGIVIAVLFI